MPRKKQWPPRPHPHKASGQERVRIDGRDVYLGPIGSQEARDNYADLVKKLAEQRPVEQPPKQKRSGLTVAEVIDRHDEDARKRYDPAGREAKQFTYACAPLLDLMPALPASRFDCAKLEQVRDEMIRRGWKREVINRRVIRLRTLWRWAERKGLVPAGSWAGLRALEPLPRNDRRVTSSPGVTVPSWPDFAKACRHANATVRAMLLTQLLGGMRSQDVRQMKVGELERPEKGEWTYRPPLHKNAWRGHSREVAVGPRARKVIAPFLEGKRPCDHVFPSGWTRQGASRGYRDDAYPRAVARACERAGVTPFTPTSLRHLARLRATRAGGLEEARAMLGHASVTTTAHQYAAGVDLEQAKAAARKVG